MELTSVLRLRNVSGRRLARSIRLLVVFFATLGAAWAATAADDEAAAVRRHLDGLRGMTVPKEKAKIDELNHRMDAAWSYVHAHRRVALPVVRAELEKAVGGTPSDQFFLLDIGFLLLTEEGDSAAPLSLQAFERLDPTADVVQANWEEVFHFAMKLGASGVEPLRHLAALDRIFLPSRREIAFFRAPHVIKLTPVDVCCMVYGVVGEAAATHIGHALSTLPARRSLLLQLLSAVGSEAEVPAVESVLVEATDFETIGPATAFLMEVGGPSGRGAVLALDGKKLDERATAYLNKIRPEVKATSLATITEALAKLDAAAVSDSKLQGLLDTMEAHNGADHETPPAALVKSKLSTDALLAQMKRIRARSFRRETNHVFEDLPITNAIINALQFKQAASRAPR